jgi:ubiquinone/menaquinone biosynthesis C-methylase UbiE
MVTSVNDLVSLRTHSALDSYPVVNGIPVILDNIEDFFAETYLMYGTHLHEQKALIRKLTRSFADDIARKNVAENLQRAIHVNSGHVAQILQALEPLFSKQTFLNTALRSKFSDITYLKAFRYLKRDWCGLPEAEEQVNIITDCLADIITRYPVANGSNAGEEALFLGAGMGKIAWRLADHFKKLYATDKSFSMAHLYSRLLNGETISFFDINTSNIRNNIDTTRNYNASLAIGGYSQSEIEVNKNKILYFLSDVCQLPLRDESVSCILSVYFTDVLPLKDYFAEIDRVLKKDGLFIHFGTLGYPFSDERHMLTAEDVKNWFFRYGYRMEVEKTVPSLHLPSFVSMHNNHVDNWCFVVRKLHSSSVQQTISDDTIIGFTESLDYTVSGSLGKGHPAVYQIHNKSRNKYYDSSEEIVDLLKLVDGKKKISQLLEEYENLYDIDEEGKQKLLEVMQFLLRERLLRISNPA